jgi:hypothetical protein
VEGEEEVGGELGGDEIAHLRGARVEDEDGDERERDQADLVADERDGLAGPEDPERLVLPDQGGTRREATARRAP